MRQEKLRDCTLKNLDKLGLGLKDPKRVLLNDGTSKTEYRSRVAKNYRILLLVGDNLEDFMNGFKSATAVRNQRAKQQQYRWGRQWIILPNPIYGDWESSLYDFDYSLPRAEMLRRKQQHLKE